MSDLNEQKTDNDVEEIKHCNKFYEDAVKYWSEVPATVEGMLGGFGFISHCDIQGSRKFLSQVMNFKTLGPTRALDCGAGIGRITKHLLVQLFDTVDMVEQNPNFLSEAKKYIGTCNKIGELFPEGLQDFTPKPFTYDLIWCQWVLGHLEDNDFVNFFKRCITGLKPNGIIVIKENVTSSGCVEVDEQDSSITRSLSEFQRLLTSAGLLITKEIQQTNLPKGLYPVYMIALKPLEI
uniref:Alpha N-terminal protein methyltransferase 1 n=1 Tax=Xenopsylla cheopis TaxID=163159 RepID=A0A6M2DM80_XENCH